MNLAKPALAVGTLMITLTGCSELDTLRDIAGSDVVRGVAGVAGLSLAGVTPAHDFRSTGNIDFDVLPEAESGIISFANLQQSGMRVEVENEDGSYSDCEYVGGEEIEASEYHALTLLLDGSGSMELAYPPSEYGDVCVTCPHDPKRERIGAARELVDRVSKASSESPMAVAEFGPQPSAGFSVTRLHSEFSTDLDLLHDSLSAVRGDDRVGTPLYDSLAEMIEATRVEAVAFEGSLRRDRGEEVPWEEADDVPRDEREVARHIVVLSDGEDNESTRHDVESVTQLALDAGVVVYAVGLGPASASSANPDVVDPEQTQSVRNLHKLARDTGGFYAAANNPAQLSSLYDAVGKALTEGYQKETYSCVPKPSSDVPEDECGCTPPPVGSRVDGRVSMGDVKIPWVTIAN